MVKESKGGMVTEEGENQVPAEEMEVEKRAAAATEVVAEEQKQRWSTVVIGVVVALLALCAFVVCIAAAVAALSGGKGTASVTGTVIYRERIVLEPDAVVKVQIQDVSRQDVAATVMGEQVIRNPGQVPIPYQVAYDPKAIQDNHTYSVRARIEDGSGKLLFTSTQNYPVITRGAPTKDVQILLERVGVEPPPPAQAYIKIDEPVYGAILDINRPVIVWGSGSGLPEGNVVVQALDRDGNVLVEQPTTLQGENVGSGGQGTWSVELSIQTEPGMAGRIYAFSRSPKDNSLIAEDSVEVSLGPTAAKPTFLEIDIPREGAELDTVNPIQVSGNGGGLPEGNVVVRALDDSDRVLAEVATILQGQDVGTGGAGTWSVALTVDVPPGTTGKLMAFSPSPLDGSYVASAAVNVIFGGAPALEGASWILADTLPGTEVKALFENGQVSGSAGCNSYSGTYVTTTVDGMNKIRIGPLASTMMMCEEAVMDQEIAYLAALQSATSYTIEGNLLTILHPDGTLLFEGEPVP
jgi:putative lipoprotein